MRIRRPLALLIGSTAVTMMIGAVIVTAQGGAKSTAAQPAKPSVAARRVTTPPLPAMGFAPVRPMETIRATYDFAAQHPEILKYVPCYCGCGSEGHANNEACFIARRDARGNVIEWDTHGYGCTICVDVARESMQLYSSGADVNSIRAAIEKKWTPSHPGTKTPTPFPPRK
ncbi:MAG: PCYCGC motif-containing (lipo)protein [Vicinamibacterales bacterium]